MKIYKLSELGRSISRNTNAEASNNWRVIWALRSLGQASPDYIALETGMDESEVEAAVGILRRKGIVKEN